MKVITEQLGNQGIREDDKRIPKVLYRGKGCETCGYSGYRGRLGVYELLELSDRAEDALRSGDPLEYARAAVSSRGYRPLVQEALDLALAGRTTVDEVFRVAGELEDVA